MTSNNEPIRILPPKTERDKSTKTSTKDFVIGMAALSVSVLMLGCALIAVTAGVILVIRLLT